jgi:hypothetical protein
MLHLAYQMAKSGITEQIQKTFSAWLPTTNQEIWLWVKYLLRLLA